MKVVVDADELIENHARGILAYEDAYPDVGMGMFSWMAVDNALRHFGLSKSDVDYDRIVAKLSAERSKR